MRDNCQGIDEKFAYYSDLTSCLSDERVLEGVEAMIANLLATKKLLHHRRKKSGRSPGGRIVRDAMAGARGGALFIAIIKSGVIIS
jgi:hypothetical protein